MSAAVKDVDRGYRDLLARMADAAKGGTVSIGILGSAAGEQAEDAKPGVTLLDVATWNEFGLGVPQRSFIRGYYDASLTENQRTLTSLWKKVVAGKLTRAQAFNQLGLRMVAGCQKRISNRGDGSYQANADSTIKRKGSSVPLIASGQLRTGISYEVSDASV